VLKLKYIFDDNNKIQNASAHTFKTDCLHISREAKDVKNYTGQIFFKVLGLAPSSSQKRIFRLKREICERMKKSPRLVIC
jgi:hypothetical protein